MSRILVLYGTSEGHTAKVARAIGARLLADGIETDIVAAGTSNPKPADYDGIVVAASVHVGGYQRAVRRWVRLHAAELGSRPAAFVSVCLSIMSTQPKEREAAAAIPHRFFETVGWHPAVVRIVAGALPYTKYNFFMRWIMKRIARQEGGDTDTSRDYEYTDWKALRSFAGEFGSLVAAPASSPTRQGQRNTGTFSQRPENSSASGRLSTVQP
jgi:menaquinone-dependent protoporphyrinogen oxidase